MLALRNSTLASLFIHLPPICVLCRLHHLLNMASHMHQKKLSDIPIPPTLIPSTAWAQIHVPHSHKWACALLATKHYQRSRIRSALPVQHDGPNMLRCSCDVVCCPEVVQPDPIPLMLNVTTIQISKKKLSNIATSQNRRRYLSVVLPQQECKNLPIYSQIISPRRSVMSKHSESCAARLHTIKNESCITPPQVFHSHHYQTHQ